MNLSNFEDENEILRRVLLLAIFNKKDGDSIQDVLVELDELKAVSLDESKRFLKEFKKDKLLIDGKFSPLGLAKVQEAKEFFTI